MILESVFYLIAEATSIWFKYTIEVSELYCFIFQSTDIYSTIFIFAIIDLLFNLRSDIIDSNACTNLPTPIKNEFMRSAHQLLFKVIIFHYLKSLFIFTISNICSIIFCSCFIALLSFTRLLIELLIWLFIVCYIAVSLSSRGRADTYLLIHSSL